MVYDICNGFHITRLDSDKTDLYLNGVRDLQGRVGYVYCVELRWKILVNNPTNIDKLGLCRPEICATRSVSAIVVAAGRAEVGKFVRVGESIVLRCRAERGIDSSVRTRYSDVGRQYSYYVSTAATRHCRHIPRRNRQSLLGIQYMNKYHLFVLKYHDNVATYRIEHLQNSHSRQIFVLFCWL